MTNTVARMTRKELRDMIESVVETTIEQKLLEILGDPDEDLPVRKSLRTRLLRQRREVAAGKRGRTIDDVARTLRLE